MHHRQFHDHGPSWRTARRFARGLFGHGHGHEHGHEHGRHGPGGRSRLGRFFEHGDLRLVILKLVAEKPRHGYDIIKAIEEMAGGAYTPSPGVVYPTLTLLEELGHISISPAEGGRKLHAITDEGLAYLVANRIALETITQRIAQAGAGGGPSPMIHQAMDNLKQALRHRLSRDGLDERQVAAVAQAINAAATAIEQI